MTKTKPKHHKRTDPPLLIPHSNASYIAECDIDEKGYPITYEIELWEYPNFLRLEANPTRHDFPTKAKAQKFAQERLDQKLVAEMTVWRVRHTMQPITPLERKIIYHYER